MRVGRLTGFALLGVTTALLLTCSVYFAWRAYSKHQQFQQWFLDRPCDFSVDLSQPGTTRSPFVQTCSISHGEAIYLALEARSGGGAAEDLRTRLKGLSGQVAIHDLGGREISRRSFTGGMVMVSHSPGEVHLVSIDPFEEGRYTITFEVEAGAAGFSGVRQRAFARYLLCGMEAFPALVNAGCAALLGLLGLIMVIVLLVVIRRGRVPTQAGDADLRSQDPRPDHDDSR